VSSYLHKCHSLHTIANITTTPTIMAPAGAGRFVAIAPLPGVYVAIVGLVLTTQFVAWGWPSLICVIAQTVVPPSLPMVVVMLTTVGVEAMVDVMEITVAGVPVVTGGGETTEVVVLIAGGVAEVVDEGIGTAEDAVVVVVAVGVGGGGGDEVVFVVVVGGGAFEVVVGDNTGCWDALCWPLQ